MLQYQPSDHALSPSQRTFQLGEKSKAKGIIQEQQQIIAKQNNINFMVHDSLMNQKAISPSGSKFMRSSEFEGQLSPSSNLSRTSYKMLQGLRSEETAQSGNFRSQHEQNQALSKLKYQKEFEGKKVPFRISNFQRQTSQKAYKSLSKKYTDQMKLEHLARMNPIDSKSGQSRDKNDTLVDNDLTSPASSVKNFMAIDDGTQIAAQTLHNTSFDHLRSPAQLLEQHHELQAHVNQKQNMVYDEIFLKQPENKAKEQSFILNTRSQFSPSKAVAYGSSAYTGLKQTKKNRKEKKNILGTRDRFGESFLQNVNGKSALKPYTEFDELQNKLKFQLQREKSPLEKYTKIMDKYKKESSPQFERGDSKVQLQYFERVHLAQMKSKNSLTLEQAQSQQVIEKPDTRQMLANDTYGADLDNELQPLRIYTHKINTKIGHGSQTDLKILEQASGADVTTVKGKGQNTSMPPMERQLNKDFGFKGVQINNDAYIDVNQLDNNTNNDEDYTQLESYSPLKFPVRFQDQHESTKKTLAYGTSTKRTLVQNKDSAIVIPSAISQQNLTPNMMTQGQQLKLGGNDSESKNEATNNSKESGSPKKIIQVKRYALPKQNEFSNTPNGANQDPQMVRKPNPKLNTNASEDRLGNISLLGSSVAMSPRIVQFDQKLVGELMIQRDAHAKLANDQRNRLVNVGFVNSIAAPILENDASSSYPAESKVIQHSEYESRSLSKKKLSPQNSKIDLSSSLEGITDQQRQRLLEKIEDSNAKSKLFGITLKSSRGIVDQTITRNSPQNFNLGNTADGRVFFQESPNVSSFQKYPAKGHKIQIRSNQKSNRFEQQLVPIISAAEGDRGSKVHLKVDPMLTKNMNLNQQDDAYIDQNQVQIVGTARESVGSSILNDSKAMLNADINHNLGDSFSTGAFIPHDPLDKMLALDGSIARFEDPQTIMRAIEENTIEDKTPSRDHLEPVMHDFVVSANQIANINKKMLNNDIQKIYAQNKINLHNLEKLRQKYQNKPDQQKILLMINELQNQVPLIENISQQITQQTMQSQQKQQQTEGQKNKNVLTKRRNTIQQSPLKAVKYAPIVQSQLQKYQTKWQNKKEEGEKSFDILNMTNHDSLTKKKQDIKKKQKLGVQESNALSPIKQGGLNLKLRHASVDHRKKVQPVDLAQLLNLPKMKTKRQSPMQNIQVSRRNKLHLPSSQHPKTDYSPIQKTITNFNHQGSGVNLSSVYSSEEGRHSSLLTDSNEDIADTDIPGHESIKNTMRILDQSLDQQEKVFQKQIPQPYSQYQLPFNPNLNQRVAAVQKHQTQQNFELSPQKFGDQGRDKVTVNWRQVKPTNFLENQVKRKSNNSLNSFEKSASAENLPITNANTTVHDLNSQASDLNQLNSYAHDLKMTGMHSGQGQPKIPLHNGTQYFQSHTQKRFQDGLKSPSFGGQTGRIQVGAHTLMSQFPNQASVSQQQNAQNITVMTAKPGFTIGAQISSPQESINAIMSTNQNISQRPSDYQQKKVVSLKFTQSQSPGDHSAPNSPHGTDGGASTKMGDPTYLFDSKLSAGIAPPKLKLSSNKNLNIIEHTPTKNMKSPVTAIIENNQILEMSREEQTQDDEGAPGGSHYMTRDGKSRVPNIHEIIEFEKAQGLTEYQENSGSPALTPDEPKDMQHLNKQIRLEEGATPNVGKATVVRTEEDDASKGPRSPRSGTTFPHRGPSPDHDSAIARQNLNNSSQEKTSSQPNLLRLIKNTSEGSLNSPKNSKSNASPLKVKNPSNKNLRHSSMSKDLIHLIDSSQPIIKPQEIHQTQTHSPFIKIPVDQPADQQSPKFQFTERSHPSNGTNLHSPRGFGGDPSDGFTQMPPGSTVTGMGPHKGKTGGANFDITSREYLPNQVAVQGNPNATQHSPRQGEKISTLHQTAAAFAASQGHIDSKTNTAQNFSSRVNGSTGLGAGKPIIQVKFSSHSLEKLVQESKSRDNSKEKEDVHSLRIREGDDSTHSPMGPMMIQGTSLQKKSEQINYLNFKELQSLANTPAEVATAMKGSIRASISIKSSQERSQVPPSHSSRVNEVPPFQKAHLNQDLRQLQQLPVAQFHYKGLPNRNQAVAQNGSSTPEGVPEYADRQKLINQTYQQRLLHTNIGEKSRLKNQVKGVGNGNNSVMVTIPSQQSLNSNDSHQNGSQLAKQNSQQRGLRLSKSNVRSVKQLASIKNVGQVNNISQAAHSRNLTLHQPVTQTLQVQHQIGGLSGTQVGIKHVTIQQQYEQRLNQMILGNNIKTQTKEFVENYFQVKQNNDMMMKATDKAHLVKITRDLEAAHERQAAKQNALASPGVINSPGVSEPNFIERPMEGQNQFEQAAKFHTQVQNSPRKLVGQDAHIVIQTGDNFVSQQDKIGSLLMSENSVGPKYSSLRSGSKAQNQNYLKQEIEKKFKDGLPLGGKSLQPKKLKNAARDSINQQQERFKNIIDRNRFKNYSNIF